MATAYAQPRGLWKEGECKCTHKVCGANSSSLVLIIELPEWSNSELVGTAFNFPSHQYMAVAWNGKYFGLLSGQTRLIYFQAGVNAEFYVGSSGAGT